MARVEIATQSFGVLWNEGTFTPRTGASVQFKTTLEAPANTYSAITGGTSSTAAFANNQDGTVPRYIDTGSYHMYVNGVWEGRVEAVSAQDLGGGSTTYADDLMTTHVADTSAVHGIADTSKAVIINVHNGTSWPTRPTAPTVVLWIGPSAPTIGGAGNAVNGDLFASTSA